MKYILLQIGQAILASWPFSQFNYLEPFKGIYFFFFKWMKFEVENSRISSPWKPKV